MYNETVVNWIKLQRYATMSYGTQVVFWGKRGGDRCHTVIVHLHCHTSPHSPHPGMVRHGVKQQKTSVHCHNTLPHWDSTLSQCDCSIVMTSWEIGLHHYCAIYIGCMCIYDDVTIAQYLCNTYTNITLSTWVYLFNFLYTPHTFLKMWLAKIMQHGLGSITVSSSRVKSIYNGLFWISSYHLNFRASIYFQFHCHLKI